MAGLAMLAPLIGGVLNSIISPSQAKVQVQHQVDNIKDKFTNGAIDPMQLKEKLLEKFGEKAEGIVNENGEIDFAKLQELLADHLEQLQHKIAQKAEQAKSEPVTAFLDVINNGETKINLFDIKV